MVSQEIPLKRLSGRYQALIRAPFPRHWLVAGVQMILDLAILSTAFVVSYLLRFDFQIPRAESHKLFVQLPVVLALQFGAMTLCGARSPIWRYAGMPHIRSFLNAATASLAVMVLLRLFLPDHYGDWRFPLSISFFDNVLVFGGTFGARVARRASYERRQKLARLRKTDYVNQRNHGEKRRPVLLIGAGDAGVMAAKEIDGRGDLHIDIRGFIDDNRTKLGRFVYQKYRVLGTSEDLPRLVSSLGIDHVVITIGQASRKDIARIIMICDQVPVKVRIIPGLNEILDGSVEISRIRDVQIQDLLGREKIELDVELISSEMTGKTVMVTGAGGSIGAELARQVLRFQPATLLLVERAEFALFDVDHKLKLAHPDLSILPLVADVGNVERMRFIFDSYRPQVIIHAAAHKHVPLMEFNVTEAMRNNVTATYLLGELAGEYGAEVFTLVSTDKAVRPTSIMGASKRFAELVVQDLNSRFETRFVAVRFGNVIGSSGSVIPIFLDQIRRGGPVTLTDRRMKRYFMTIPEAAQLVLQASALGKGGEVFILQMGEPVLIKDLAETLIRLSGLKPHEDIEIVETGLRPGEKLCEELRFESEETDATEHSKIFINKIATFDQKAIESALERINELLLSSDEKALIKLLSELVPEARLNGYLAKPQTQVAQSGK